MEESFPQNLNIDQILKKLQSQKEGLSERQATERLKIYGLNVSKPPKQRKGAILFLAQFKNSLILLLLGAAILSFSLGAHLDTSLILTIIILSGALGFFQEYGAINALEKLLALVESKTSVIREGQEKKISSTQLVPGDIILLKAGDPIPADCFLIESTYLYVNEAMMTGESVPVERTVEIGANTLFLGTFVANGFGLAIVFATGKKTKYAKLADNIRFRPPETAFEIGVKKFSQFLLEVTLVLVIVIFVINSFLHKPIIESLLFSLALAVGLTPQLLPAIISVNLAHGARRMFKKNVIVKRLPSIENFGQMNILCSDKTGTITTGIIELKGIFDVNSNPIGKGNLYAFLNAHFQEGYVNPMDQAIVRQEPPKDLSEWKKIGEVPYDFIRKRLSVILEYKQQQILITKGAFASVLSICSKIELANGSIVPIIPYQDTLTQLFEQYSNQGFRILGLAYGHTDQESNLTFLGLIHFFDPIKPGIMEVVTTLKKQGVSLKIITGDHPSVALYAAKSIGLTQTSLMTGEELRNINEEALMKILSGKNIFAQVDPNQKESIISALRKQSNIVGYLGDGINDMAALHSADVGIAVDSGADAAKETADIVLLKKDLSVLSVGIEEGRKAFLNTLKYVYMATSANFGNMFSMAGASLFLKFLPLLPKQVLLTNFFSDLPEMALATDHVDANMLKHPVKWDLPMIHRFMLLFGLLNSFADYMTFGILLFILHADESLFRSGWFIENVVSAALIVLIVRTKKPFFKSKPSTTLIATVLLVTVIAPLIPLTPLGALFGLSPIPLKFYPPLVLIIIIYIIAVEIAKHFFFKKFNYCGVKQ